MAGGYFSPTVSPAAGRLCRGREPLADADGACGQPRAVRAGGKGLLVFKQGVQLWPGGEAPDHSRPQLFDGMAQQ
jgi:hypothetical protein